MLTGSRGYFAGDCRGWGGLIRDRKRLFVLVESSRAASAGLASTRILGVLLKSNDFWNITSFKPLSSCLTSLPFRAVNEFVSFVRL